MRHKHTILVVEDESLIRFGLVDILETEGFATREAASAMQAIEILKADEAIDIVLTDIEMPGSMDGLAPFSLHSTPMAANAYHSDLRPKEPS